MPVPTFSEVNLEIVQFPDAAVNMAVVCLMGKLSGQTLAQTVGYFPLGAPGQIEAQVLFGERGFMGRPVLKRHRVNSDAP